MFKGRFCERTIHKMPNSQNKQKESNTNEKFQFYRLQILEKEELMRLQ
jgi:hypothetical protein